MTEYMRDGFVRQRRNLMMVSAALLLVESAGVKFSELNLLGNKFLIENPGVINIGLWIAFLYWLYRYYVYFHDIGEKGFVSKYRSRMMDLVCAIAFKQLNTTRTEWLPSATQGKTRLQLGPDRSFYQRLLWRYEIKLSVLYNNNVRSGRTEPGTALFRSSRSERSSSAGCRAFARMATCSYQNASVFRVSAAIRSSITSRCQPCLRGGR